MVVYILQEDFSGHPTEQEQGYRKRKNTEEWRKECRKRARNSLQVVSTLKGEPRISCKHDNTHCAAKNLTQEDITGTFYFLKVTLAPMLIE